MNWPLYFSRKRSFRLDNIKEKNILSVGKQTKGADTNAKTQQGY